MNFNEGRLLGRTGIKVGRLGISSNYGAPARAYEEAFERGCNYFLIGSFFRGHSGEMARAIRNIISKGKRDELVIAVNDYTHSGLLQGPRLRKGLKSFGTDHADIMILGYYLRRPRKAILASAMGLKDKGVVRHIGIASHHRPLFRKLLDDDLMDVFHLRYNAVNRGAEQDVFPYLGNDNNPGIVSYTATRWGQLLKEDKMPPGEEPLSAVDCYRFVLSHPSVDLCLTGTRSLVMMQENLRTLDMGPLNEGEMERIRRIGDYVYGKKRESEG